LLEKLFGMNFAAKMSRMVSRHLRGGGTVCDDAGVVTSPHISILIPAFNEQDLIAGTIESVHRSFADIGAYSYEIVVCDNNSTDRTAEIARAARAQVVFEPHNQIARARNTAAKAALGQWFIFLDADTLLNPATLRATIAALESGRTGAGGSVVRLGSDRLGPGPRMLLRTWNTVSRILKLAAGSYVFCLRDAWAATGGFDEGLYVSEEIWFSRELKRWCRAQGRTFTILTAAPITTSARKLHWYSPWQLWQQFAVFLIPGTWRNREKCATWYKRPLPRDTD
jgi:glycosyltransferase involved in cell wall biosynthesis